MFAPLVAPQPGDESMSLGPLTPAQVLVGDTASSPASTGYTARTLPLPQFFAPLTSLPGCSSTFPTLQMSLKNSSLKHVKVQ